MARAIEISRRFRQVLNDGAFLYRTGVLGAAGWNVAHGTVPEHTTMGIIGFLALLA